MRYYKGGLDSVKGFYTTSHPSPMQCDPGWKSSLVFVLYRTRSPYLWSALCLESEGSTNLVVGLIELLGIERSSNAKGDTGSEEDVVGNSGDTTVVDLGLVGV